MLNLLTTPRSDNYFDFIYPCRWFIGRAQFMHPPRIRLCLGGKFSFLLHMLLVSQPIN